MAASLFDFVAGLLEERTNLEPLEPRGTLRIALKAAGLEAKGLERQALLAVIERLLPAELASRAVPDPTGICAQLSGDTRRAAAFEDPLERSPEDVFRRLGEG